MFINIITKHNNKVLLGLFIVVLLLAKDSVSAFQVRVSAPEHLFDSKDLVDYNNLKISINGGNRFIYPHQKNTFNIVNLISTRNMIEIVSNLYLYPILMVDQKANSDQKVYNLVHPITRQIIRKIDEPLIISPIDRIKYFQPEGGFEITSFLFSGTGLMIIFGLFLFLCYQQLMPKLQQAQAAPA